MFNCWTRKNAVSTSGTYSNDLPGGGLVAIRKRSSCPLAASHLQSPKSYVVQLDHLLSLGTRECATNRTGAQIHFSGRF